MTRASDRFGSIDSFAIIGNIQRIKYISDIGFHLIAICHIPSIISHGNSQICIFHSISDCISSISIFIHIPVHRCYGLWCLIKKIPYLIKERDFWIVFPKVLCSLCIHILIFLHSKQIHFSLMKIRIFRNSFFYFIEIHRSPTTDIFDKFLPRRLFPFLLHFELSLFDVWHKSYLNLKPNLILSSQCNSGNGKLCFFKKSNSIGTIR